MLPPSAAEARVAAGESGGQVVVTTSASPGGMGGSVSVNADSPAAAGSGGMVGGFAGSGGTELVRGRSGRCLPSEFMRRVLGASRTPDRGALSHIEPP